MFILKKKIDWSLLTAGLTIPVEFQPIIQQLKGGVVEKGMTRTIKILIDQDVFEAKLTNIDFDRKKYQTHSDLLQIRYTDNSPIAKKLQMIFSDSFSYLKLAKQLPENKHKQIKLPDDVNEYITLSSTDLADTFIVDYYTSKDNRVAYNEILNTTEYEYELLNFEPIYDDNASIVETSCIKRVRKLDRSIAETLKQLYDYRCQITGERIGNEFGCSVVEAHHIEYFTKSLNNDTSNIIIVNPSFHRIIHQTSPIFDRKTLSFVFPNGVIEKVKLDKHLNCK